MAMAHGSLLLSRNMPKISLVKIFVVFLSLAHIYRVRYLSPGLRNLYTFARIAEDATLHETIFTNSSQEAELPETLIARESIVTPQLSPNNIGKYVTHEEAVFEYKRKVNATHRNAQRCVARRKNAYPKSMASINVTYALDCLRLTTPNLQLHYPIDAEEHYNEIRLKMAQWAQHERHKYHTGAGYSGPWMENAFITRFETLFDEQSVQTNNTCLPDYFGPFIPLFLPWVDHWVLSKSNYPKGFIEVLRSVLRPDVPYITVSQNDQGLRGYGFKFPMESIPNVLVLSAGGYGHVPIPLIKQEEPRNNYIDVQDRTIDVSFVGSLAHAPYDARNLLHQQLMSQSTASSSNASTWTPASSTPSSVSYHYYYGNDWRTVMRHSRYSLVPRGFGRTAYHLMETLQMGLVPIYIYLDNDVPWIPYPDLFPEIGYVSTFNQSFEFVKSLQEVPIPDIEEREKRIISMRESHFSVEGTLNQIGRFMKGLKSDLRCQALPPSTTGKK